MKERAFGNVLGTLLLAGLPMFGQDYVPRSVPSLGGGHTIGFALNSKGEVAGETLTSGKVSHSFFWSRSGGIVDLDLLIGQQVTLAGLNATGTIAGISSQRAVVWNAEAGLQDLGTFGGPSSIAEGINDMGQVAGCADTGAGARNAFVWFPGSGIQDIDPDINDTSCAFAVSSNGNVTGQIGDGKGGSDTFVWSPPGGLQLTGLGNQVHPFSINDAGEITGYYQTPTGLHAFFWDVNGGLEDLGVGEGVSVNKFGQVLGDDLSGRPFLWTHAGGRHLVPQLVHGWTAVAINDAGQILVRASARTRVLTPAVKISLTSSANPSQVGQSVTFTANAASVQGVPPDGELIVFKVSNKVLAKVPLVAGSASVTTSTLKTGTHQVTAQYVGDVHYFASKSPALNQIVNP